MEVVKGHSRVASVNCKISYMLKSRSKNKTPSRRPRCRQGVEHKIVRHLDSLSVRMVMTQKRGAGVDEVNETSPMSHSSNLLLLVIQVLGEVRREVKRQRG